MEMMVTPRPQPQWNNIQIYICIYIYVYMHVYIYIYIGRFVTRLHQYDRLCLCGMPCIFSIDLVPRGKYGLLPSGSSNFR